MVGTGRYAIGGTAYRRGLYFVAMAASSGVAEGALNAVGRALQLNLALCCLKEERWALAAIYCSRVLSAEAANPKALYRRAVARRQCGALAAAEADLRALIAVQPKNKAARKEWAAVARAKAER